MAIIVVSLSFQSCSKEELSNKNDMLSFLFEQTKNPKLDKTYIGEIINDQVSVDVSYSTDLTNLISSIEISPNATISPTNITDFTNEVTYTVTAENGNPKEFFVNVEKETAPYVGTWISNAFDIGQGLMKLKVEITEGGDITIDYTMVLSGNRNNNSIKGTFDPQSLEGEDILIVQTYGWISGQWQSVEEARTFMFQFDDEQKTIMTFYYCDLWPKTAWCFQIKLNKE